MAVCCWAGHQFLPPSRCWDLRPKTVHSCWSHIFFQRDITLNACVSEFFIDAISSLCHLSLQKSPCFQVARLELNCGSHWRLLVKLACIYQHNAKSFWDHWCVLLIQLQSTFKYVCQLWWYSLGSLVFWPVVSEEGWWGWWGWWWPKQFWSKYVNWSLLEFNFQA